MKIILQNLVLVCSVLFIGIGGALAQSSSISGTASDNSGERLIGANVVLKSIGTDKIFGTVTDVDGNYVIIDVPYGDYSFNVSYTGYTEYEQLVSINSPSMNLGSTVLDEGAIELASITVVGVADIAVDRRTPVAVSTISSREIQSKLGNLEFPEILKSTPSIYATKQGGGWGDARINIRGFTQENIAIMINGVPVNDMENGRVFWSNWAGLSDVTSFIQVQRGLGSSKLAIASVGGTINVLTKTAEQDQGGVLGFTTGNDGFLKFTGAYNTGQMENGFSASVLISNTRGNGFVDGTKFQGSNYFFALGYKPSNQHNVQFTFTGAPQWHHQRSFAPSISDYIQFNPEADGEPDIKYNSDWGMLNGEEFTFRRNFYHKPVMSINWDWNISPKMTLSSVVYGSWGRGGGTGEIGRSDGKRGFDGRLKTSEGIVDFDLIQSYNSGNAVTIDGDQVTRTQTDNLFVNTGSGDRSSANGISRRSSMNSHNWYGSIINLNNKLSDELSLDIGVDWRTYRGIHYRTLNSLLGGDVYEDNDNINNQGNRITTLIDAKPSFNPFQSITDQPRLDYNNDGKVRWAGLFSQLEYSKDKISAFIQGSVSQQGFKRFEFFGEETSNQETEYENLTGGNVKGGLNYNISDVSNIYFNSGFYSKQPLFDAVYLNFGNNLNPNLTNEKIVGLELGYGLRTSNFKADINLFRTTWKDRFLDESSNFDINNTPDDSDDDIRGTANILGIEQVHMGLEVNFESRVSDDFKFTGFLSVGNYEYGGDVEATFIDEEQNIIVVNGVEQIKTLYLDGVKVGDAAQFTGGLGASYQLFEGFRADANWRYDGNLYADINPEDFDESDHQGSLELPSFSLFDAGLSYYLSIGEKQGLSFRLNLNNVFDKTYISESDSNRFAEAGDETWNGINTRNGVFFGWGRSWNLGARYSF